MRHVIRLNRKDIAQFTQGQPIDFEIRGHVITWEFDGPAKANGLQLAVHPNGHRSLDRRVHTEAFKRAAVARFKKAKAAGTETGQAIADDLDISRSLLTTWAKRLK